MPAIEYERLQEFAEGLLQAGGALDAEAALVARSLVQANLRGHDSHGVMRVPYYVNRVREGGIQPGATLQVENDAPGSLVGDGGWGFGQMMAREVMSRILEKAENTGVASGTLRRSAHIGRLGEYAEMAAERNMLALITANTHGAAQRVAPVGGKRPRLGTNPLCMGVPGGEEGPFILDFGTSATAEGKVRVKRIAGEPVPEGWILDPEGRPTTDPNQLYGDPPGSILPMGGSQAYKGFGLAFMIEMFTSGLSGAPCAHPDPPPPVGNAALFMVISPDCFAGADHLQREVRQLENYVRGVPLIDGVDRVTLPGDPERRVMRDRLRDGIPLDEGNWSALLKLADELSVAPPQ